LNVDALVSVIAFAVVFVAIFGALYTGAWRSYRKGELDFTAVRLLRWALFGFAAIYVLLAITSLFS